MFEDQPIPPLTTIWWIGLIATLATIAALLTLGRRLDAGQRLTATRVIGVLACGKILSYQAQAAGGGVWNAAESLPLHLCGIAGVLAAVLMLRPSQLLYEIVYYWAIAGALHSLLTPVLTVGTGPFQVADFYLGHGMILFIALWATFVLGRTPRRGSWWRIFLLTQLLLPTVGALNWLLGANYLFLCEPPVVDNPLVMGRFPYHILGFEIALLVHLLVLYAPFSWRYRRLDRAQPAG